MTTPKGERRRTAIVAAAARLALDDGPAAVTHRRVADAASVPLAATTYYFSSRDDLLAEAGARIVSGWALTAERVVADLGPGLADDLIRALLPRRVGNVRGHYEHLVAAGRIPALARAYRDGRRRLEDAVGQILAAHGSSLDPGLVIAVVDGAVVSALSEDRPVKAEVRQMLELALG
ncbi:TetR/AcrR family transcriptional regulator [Epidermidibacterium keratini]|uniref:TetR/AcrR family transcriptional regulator n=1 Tax=Epidermidibacterium keratini TaxID=1891644 RepID=UPI001CEF8C20|nr:TetR family transcriptional regulator [Epidermidibacterium keratini]